MYGKKQNAVVPLVCGVVLMVFPYFISNVIFLVTIGLVLIAVPYFVRFRAVQRTIARDLAQSLREQVTGLLGFSSNNALERTQLIVSGFPWRSVRAARFCHYATYVYV